MVFGCSLPLEKLIFDLQKMQSHYGISIHIIFCVARISCNYMQTQNHRKQNFYFTLFDTEYFINKPLSTLKYVNLMRYKFADRNVIF